MKNKLSQLQTEGKYCKRCQDRLAVVYLLSGEGLMDGAWCMVCLRVVSPVLAGFIERTRELRLKQKEIKRGARQ